MTDIESTNEYDEALHFVRENPPEVVARQMAKDMISARQTQKVLNHVMKKIDDTILSIEDTIKSTPYHDR